MPTAIVRRQWRGRGLKYATAKVILYDYFCKVLALYHFLPKVFHSLRKKSKKREAAKEAVEIPINRVFLVSQGRLELGVSGL